MEARRRQRPSADPQPKSQTRAQVSVIQPTRKPAPSPTDSLLLKVTQLIILLGLIWFIYLIASVNTAISSSAISEAHNIRGSIANPVNGASAVVIDAAPVRQQIQSIRNEFYHRYGGKDESLAMLKRGLKTFATSSTNEVFAHDSLKGTARRLLSTLIENEQEEPGNKNNKKLAPFIFSFGGYSVTVGRGNHFTQSFPFVFQSVAKPLLQTMGIDLIVRNSAIGGIPSFPYGWCLPNFLGGDSHAISWDYGMNEGNGGSGLESYLRNGLSVIHGNPMFVMVDTKKSRMDVLQYYVDEGVMVDPLALGRGDAVKKELLNLPNEKRPIGLRDWDQWGAPKGAPGQSPWHPKKMEHELMGWMLAMYFVDSVEVALDLMSDADWKESLAHDAIFNTNDKLPHPTTNVKETGVPSLLHGIKNDKDEWTIPRVSCRTSFLPNISGHLESIIVSGVTKDEEDMIKPRDDALFDRGWVMDVGKVERETKEKVNKYGGLGYIDMKTALYGIKSSGTLKLWLPHEGSTDAKNGNRAVDHFQSVVFCEVNEKRGSKECNMLSDLEFRIGNASVSKNDVKQVHGVASYLKKDICIHVDIPNEAQITLREGAAGLDVEISVANGDVSRENGACSISHVIWQHK